MSDTEQKPSYAAEDPYEAPIRREPTAWVGFVLFGGIMMLMMGGFQAIEGFAPCCGRTTISSPPTA